MDNPETLATLGTQVTRRRQTNPQNTTLPRKLNINSFMLSLSVNLPSLNKRKIFTNEYNAPIVECIHY